MNDSGLADEVMKLLDSGHTVVLFKNGLGSYTATCTISGSHEQDKAMKQAAEAKDRYRD